MDVPGPTGVDQPMTRIVAVLAAITAPAVSAAQIHVAEGGEVLLEAPAGAADWAWDLDGDGAFRECAHEAQCIFSAAGLDGPTEATVDLYVAYDDLSQSIQPLSIEVDNVVPTIVSAPPTGARRGGLYFYAPTVVDPAGASDPWTLELLDNAFPDGMEADPVAGELWWTPRADQLGEHEVTIAVEDDDGGRTEQMWTIEVTDNAAPSAPELLYPIGTGSDCTMVDRPTFKVSNAVDPDGDPLVYLFEVDSDAAFRSIYLQASGAMPEGVSGFSEWQVPRSLANGTYYWRAWTSDGYEESDKIVEVFEVCVHADDPCWASYNNDCPDEPQDDAGDDAPPVGEIATSRHAGCTCYSSREADDGAEASLGLLSMALLFGLRRRRP